MAIDTKEVPARTAILTNVSSSATSIPLLLERPDRKGATIMNDSTQVLYVKFGSIASTTSYTVLMQTMTYYEVPYGYTGRIDGVWAAANGTARITEVV